MQKISKENKRQQAFVLEHLDYAKGLARRFYIEHCPAVIEYEDIVAAAYLGLCDAAYRFDSSKGVSFKTFSYLRIRGEMFDLLRRYFPMPRRRPAPKSGEGIEEHSEESLELQRELNSEERAADEQVHDALGIIVRGTHREQRFELSYLQNVSPSCRLEKQAVEREVRAMVEELPETERQLLNLKYFEGKNYTEIRDLLARGHKSGFSRIHKRALKRMREIANTDELFS